MMETQLLPAFGGCHGTRICLDVSMPNEFAKILGVDLLSLEIRRAMARAVESVSCKPIRATEHDVGRPGRRAKLPESLETAWAGMFEM